jgi:uncharacterized YccA/Bax inhibitor family protein
MKHICFWMLIVFFLFPLPFAAAQESTAGEDQTESAVEQEAAKTPPKEETALETLETIEEKADADTHTMGVVTRLGIALAIIIVQALLIWLVWRLFKHLSGKIAESGGDKIKPLTIKN